MNVPIFQTTMFYIQTNIQVLSCSTRMCGVQSRSWYLDTLSYRIALQKCCIHFDHVIPCSISIQETMSVLLSLWQENEWGVKVAGRGMCSGQPAGRFNATSSGSTFIRSSGQLGQHVNFSQLLRYQQVLNKWGKRGICSWQPACRFNA